MGDGSLSQDEIDALLQGADDMLSSPGMGFGAESSQSSGGMSPVERDSLGDLLNNVMGVVAPALGAILQKNARISNAIVEVKPADAVRSELSRQYVQVSLGYNGSANGQNLIVFNLNDAGVISSLMMGDDSGTPPSDMNEAHQSTLGEFVSQLLFSAANQLADKAGGVLNVTPPSYSVANSGAQLQLPPGDVVKITYNLSVEGVLNTKFYHIMEMGLASRFVRSSGPAAGGYSGGMQAQPMMMQQQQGVGISPVKFPPLGEGIPQGIGQNIGLLMDVQLTLTVELGRTKQLVKDILGLGEGSIIELDKLAGEPVDLLVNGRLIAKGEVVVIDENFGVGVTDIVSPSERLSMAGSGQ
jgi:flagellar motor switch protein FliN/FliY